MFRKTVKNDWVKLATPSDKFERLEAFFTGHGYDPHRHDTYAIGRTLSGIQSFKYRGSRRQSLAGHTMVLHPDEIHDGEAGTADGFHYRMIYIEPSSIQKYWEASLFPLFKGGRQLTRVLLRRRNPYFEEWIIPLIRWKKMTLSMNWHTPCLPLGDKKSYGVSMITQLQSVPASTSMTSSRKRSR